MYEAKSRDCNLWRFRHVIASLLILSAVSLNALGANGSDSNDLFNLSLEQLMNVEVTSSGRRPQPITHAASAMYVITAEDIHQSGATRLEDILRLVPGMDVVRTKSSYLDVAMSARGFAKVQSRRMQILLDGRPLYDGYKGGTPLIEHPIFLEDIERIEVIRGSGGVSWGVNAMNGVINIISKKAAATQGGLVYGGFGPRGLQEGFIRWGGTKGNLAARGTVGTYHTNGFGTGGGDNFEDQSHSLTSTGYGEYKLRDDSILTFSGGQKTTTFGKEGVGSTVPYIRKTEYMNMDWEKTLQDGQVVNVRWSENFYEQISKTHKFYSREDMIEFSYRFSYENHNIVWGGDYTRDSYEFKPNSLASKNTLSDTTHTYNSQAYPLSNANNQGSLWIEDEITLAKNLWWTVGFRGHINELTDFDWAGRTALVWEFKTNHFLRGGISRSFRRPVMLEMYSTNIAQGGSESMPPYGELQNETLISYELGYRGKFAKNFELNIEGFVNKHSDLIAVQRVRKTATSYRNNWRNSYDVTTYGVETSIDWKPFSWWLVRASHSYEHQSKGDELNTPTTSTLTSTSGDVGVFLTPKHKFGLTNRFYIDKSTTLNTQLFYTTSYLDDNGADERVAPYLRFDFRLSRKFWKDAAEVAVGATNLTDAWHNESSNSSSDQGALIPRQIYFQFFYKF